MSFTRDRNFTHWTWSGRGNTGGTEIFVSAKGKLFVKSIALYIIVKGFALYTFAPW